MAEIVKMPKLSDTMEEGVVAEWHKKVGDQVSAGDLLAEIETDKATMEFESFQDGTLLYIGVKKGEAAPVDSILAILGEKGEDIDDLLQSKENGANGSQKQSEEDAKKADADKDSATDAEEEKELEENENASAATSKKDDEQDSAAADEQHEQTQKNAASDKSAQQTDQERIKASPLAKKMAEDRGVDIRAVKGSGDNGRIVKKDIENYKEQPAVATGAESSTQSGKEAYTEEPVSQMRKAIAKSLSQSKFTAPHFYLTVEIDMEQAMQSRASINEALAPAKISVNDLVMKAAAMALRKHPRVNSAWMGEKIRYNQHIHMGVAVAVDEGLLVPVIRFADQKSMVQINEEVKAYAEKARNKKLQPADWEGSTFTISNLGMFGIENFTAIINPPNSCILAVGTAVEKPVVRDGQIVVGHTMKVTLSCDHRIVDGAVGAAFLQTFRQYMEQPVMMLAH